MRGGSRWLTLCELRVDVGHRMLIISPGCGIQVLKLAIHMTLTLKLVRWAAVAHLEWFQTLLLRAQAALQDEFVLLMPTGR